ncbi:PspC domain-containing protein [Sphingomonas sp. HDW15A]|uniref:PspC domain-containing protein n=1 Tax=Sphingomonas sp. HDW15A TaxID=2714942 RepID=UPI00140BD588|nr:PspC domain-containing protein [Sphingomonas sp. HDW15A]QIK95340.1 PspC domain-containing protein [Sphingomonas sp. HDW15A]
MANHYSLNRRDKKIAGVCSTAGDIFNIDPTILRIGFAAVALMVSWKLALIAYVGAAIYFAIQRKKANEVGQRPSEFERMAEAGKRRTSVHDVRTKLDATDRRLMAIDHHLAQQSNHELAREIEALREDK